MATLYWLTNDLRIHDNPALQLASQDDVLLCVYVVEPRWFRAEHYQVPAMGDKRWFFIQQALSDLNVRLLPYQQQVVTLYGPSFEAISQQIERYSIDRVVRCRNAGWQEQQVWRALGEHWPTVTFEETDSYTLFELHQVSSLNLDWPMSYSKFSAKSKPLEVSLPVAEPTTLPKMPQGVVVTIVRPHWLPLARVAPTGVDGGETTALNHLDQYFSSSALRTYKTTRNALIGWYNSSKLSFWLAHGNISVRTVLQRLQQAEREHGKNESTEWLLKELLWREFFQWLAHWQGVRLFSKNGLAKQGPLTSFYADRFKRWCHGQTPYALVNACMNELRSTGYLSNRGRQIAASCLVNELQVDWRYGAAWFEQQLIDYDVASNWGNWQYIAGVGVDPRGGRHFNLDKQREQYDVDGEYCARWRGEQCCLPLDSQDATGWPIGLTVSQ